MSPKIPVAEHEDDEVIVVTLTRKDAEIMRDIIEKQKSLNWIGKYVRTVLFVFAGGALTIITFWGQIVTIAKGVLGIT